MDTQNDGVGKGDSGSKYGHVWYLCSISEVRVNQKLRREPWFLKVFFLSAGAGNQAFFEYSPNNFGEDVHFKSLFWNNFLTTTLMVRAGLAVREDFILGVHHVSICVCISEVTSFWKKRAYKKVKQMCCVFVVSLDHLVSHGIVSKTIAIVLAFF